MADEAIIGSVAVAVTPDARDFWRRFQEQTHADAATTGREEGKNFVRGMETAGPAKIKVEAETAEAQAQIKAVKASADDGSNSVNKLAASLVALAPPLIPLASGLAGLGAGLVGIGIDATLAVKGINNEIDQGTQLGQQYATGLDSLKESLAGLEHTAASGVLTGFEQSLTRVQAEIPQLNSFIAATSTQLGDIAAHGIGALINLLTAAEPLIVDAETAIDQLVTRLEGWSQGPAGADFFNQLADDIPLAVSAIGDLGSVVAKLLTAAEPIGTTLLHGIDGVAEGLNAIPVPVLEALITGFVTLKIVQLAQAGAASLAASADARLAASQAAVAETGAAAAASSSRLGASLAFIGTRAVPIAGVAFALDQISAHAQGAESTLSRLGALLHGDLEKAGQTGNFGGVPNLTGNSGKYQDTNLGNADGMIAAATTAQALADALKNVQAPLSGTVSGFQDYSNALDQTVSNAQKYIDLGTAANTVDEKQRVTLNGMTTSQSVFNQALALTNNNQDEAIALVADAQYHGEKYASILAQQVVSQQTLKDSINATAHATGLTVDQVEKYTDALGINYQQLSLGLIRTKDLEAAVTAISRAFGNGDTSVQAWSAAVAQFSQSADTAADRASLIAARLKFANGDLLDFTSTMASATAADAALTNAFQQQADAQSSAGRQVESAQQAIANAIDQETQSEQQLRQAQLQATTAQRALTGAREDAKRAIEDLNNQVIDGVLAQKRAVLDLAEARRNAAANPNDPSAQLSVEEAVQRLKELQLQNQRLAEEKKESDRAGVEGSQQVVSAQQAIVQALDAVRQAQRAQAQAAQGVASANQSLTDALAAQSKALTDSERAAINAKTGLIDYTKAGAGPLTQQLGAIQEAAGKAAAATYQHELATKGAKVAADDAYRVYVSETRGFLEDNADKLSLAKDQAKKFADEYYGLANAKDIKKQIEEIGADKATQAISDLAVAISKLDTDLRIKLGLDDKDFVYKIGKDQLRLDNLLKGKPGGGFGIEAHGGVLDFYANGAINKFAGGAENHVAQIAPAGAWRVWAEPETGGEAYIPLADEKRPRSEEILDAVANRFGGRYQRGPANTAPVRTAGRGLTYAPTNNFYNVAPDLEPTPARLERIQNRLG